MPNIPKTLGKFGNLEQSIKDAKGALSMLKGYVGAEEPSVMRPNELESYEKGKMLGMASDATGLGGALKGLGGLAMAGMIRRGGDPLLNMFHSSQNIPGLARLLENRGSFTSPSIGVSRDNPFAFAQAPTFIFNPDSPLFDPRINRANQFYNRDFYASRGKTLYDYPPEMRTGMKPASRTLRYDPDLRFTEGSLPEEAHRLAILASPRFRSFAEYERSPYGKGNLTVDFGEPEQNISLSALDEVNRLRKEYGLSTNASARFKLMDLENKAYEGDPFAQSLLTSVKSLPSAYGELKVIGEVPINKRNVSGMIIPENFDMEIDSREREALRRVQDFLGEKGIPSGIPSQFLNPADEVNYQNIAKKMEQSLFELPYFSKIQSGDFDEVPYSLLLPKEYRRYVRDSTLAPGLRGIDSIGSYFKNTIVDTPGVASDIASRMSMGYPYYIGN